MRRLTRSFFLLGSMVSAHIRLQGSSVANTAIRQITADHGIKLEF
jgi:hypothetical protein